MKVMLFSKYRSKENECQKHIEKEKKECTEGVGRSWYEELTVLEAVDDCEVMLVMARRWRLFYKHQYCVENDKWSIREKLYFGMCSCR